MSNKYYGWGMEDDEFYVRYAEFSIDTTRFCSIFFLSETYFSTNVSKMHGACNKCNEIFVQSQIMIHL